MDTEKYRNVRPFFVILLSYQLVLAILVLIYGYNGSFLLLNGFHNGLFDVALFLLTHLGDALVLTSLLGLILIRKYPALVLMLILVVVITGLTGQLMKLSLFDSWDRPLQVFGRNAQVHTVFGYQLYRNSFPSGHSITVAAAFTTCVLVLKPRLIATVFLALLTALVSYTRIYVGAHFPGDVLAGTVIGIAGAGFLTLWLYPVLSKRMDSLTDKRLAGVKTGLFLLASGGLAVGLLFIGSYIFRY